MLKLSKLTDYSTILLLCLNDQKKKLTAAALSELTKVPEPTVAKLLKVLTSKNLINSHRGVNGGYQLNKELSEISVANIIEAIDGPILITSCCGGNVCKRDDCCEMKGKWDFVNDSVRALLEKITLKDILISN